ncbi:Two pore domain potassium channel,Potassium channel domain [Cinara cedri]|uniref:Two pore domain potassium channel,Potassium channel domain n=1 Tax=Cinara cedri TaxID=506608 RepID=A0A5E4MC05_9HEMI|nr:Two pore domain potassium channel,Potassium channel domain [Cinara cedri]
MTNSPGAYHATAENNRNIGHATSATSASTTAQGRRGQADASHYIMPADPHSCCDPAPTVLSGAGICLIVLGYTMFGAFTFMTLENGGGGARDTVQQQIRNGQQQQQQQQHQHQHQHQQPPVVGQQQQQLQQYQLARNDKLRAQTVEKLWKITEDLNILYRDNWTRLAEQEILKFQDTLIRKYGGPNQTDRRHRWNFASSFLYSLTLITTIGYGSVTPQTPWGRVITIVYALIGIPLMLLYLSTMGETLAKNFRRIYSRLCSPSSGHRDDREDDDGIGRGRSGSGKRAPPNTVSSNHVGATDYMGGSGGGDYYHHRYEFETVSGAAAYADMASGGSCSTGSSGSGGQKRVPVLLSLSVVAAYVALGAFIYQKLERWTLLEGSYFCFTSLGTIGFGELVPGGVESTKDVSVFVSSGYILVGMAVVAMCFQLLQDELAAMSRNCRWCCCWWWWWSQQQQQQHYQQQQQQIHHRQKEQVVVCTVGGAAEDDDASSPPPSSRHSGRGRQSGPPHHSTVRNSGSATSS